MRIATSGHVRAGVLQQAIDRLTGSAIADLPVDDALQLIIESSHAVFGLAGTGLMLLDDLDVLRYVASSDERARVLETVQEQTGEGPCVDSAVYARIVETEDATVDSRWPKLARALTGCGVSGVLGVPIRLNARTVGSLNAYSEKAHAWDESDRTATRAFEALIEGLLQASIAAQRKGASIEQLQYALEHRVVIERAVGMIMERQHIDAPAAFEHLRTVARRRRARTADVAERHLAGEPLD